MDLGGGLAGMCCIHICEEVALWTCNDIQDLSEDGSILEKGHLINCVVKDTSFCVSALWVVTYLQKLFGVVMDHVYTVNYIF